MTPNKKDGFIYFKRGVVQWRYKEIIHPEFNQPYYYAESKYDGDEHFENNYNLLLVDNNPSGYRKNVRLQMFERELLEHLDDMKKIESKITIKKGKRASRLNRHIFAFHLIDDYKTIMMDNHFNLSAYINTAIKEKLIRDNLLTENIE